MNKPESAYRGDLPYVFVCYSHADAEVVYPEIRLLQDRGVRVWYDEGISAGRVWRSEIGSALLGARQFLYYISRSALASDHCSREIHLALDEGKDILPIFLEDVPLTPDLRVGLARLQALFRWRDTDYERRLLQALNANVTAAAPDRTQVPTEFPHAGRPPLPMAPESAGSGPAGQSPQQRTAIAVLPFTNLSGDPEQEFFSDGISEDILDGLARNPHVIVRARHSSFLFKGTRDDMRTISAQLDVTHLLTGSVRTAGSRIRINARLTSVRDDVDVWSERYDRELGDMFSLQDDITNAVLKALDVLFAVRRRSEVNPAAYRAFLLGRAHMARFEHADAERWLIEAAELDDRFADPIASLAQLCVIRDSLGLAPHQLLVEQEREYVEQALARDPGQINARGLRALTLASQSAIDELHRLVVEAPANPDVVFYYSVLMRRIGRTGLELDLLDHALSLDPLSPRWYATRGDAYTIAGRLDEAEADFLTAERLGMPVPHFRQRVAWMKGDATAAQRQIDRPDADWTWVGKAWRKILTAVTPYLLQDDRGVTAALTDIDTEFDYLPELAHFQIALFRRRLPQAIEHMRNALRTNEFEAWRIVLGGDFYRRTFPGLVESDAYQALLREFGLDEATRASLSVPPLPI